MAETTKRLSEYDMPQIIQKIYNDAGMICTEGWVTGKVGRKIVLGNATTTVPNDTDTASYIEDGVTLLVLHTVYQDATKQVTLYVERMQ